MFSSGSGWWLLGDVDGNVDGGWEGGHNDNLSMIDDSIHVTEKHYNE